MKDNDKAEFTRKATDNNGSIMVTVPPEIANHLDLEPGDKIGMQTEHSDIYKEYASIWNDTKQREKIGAEK